MTSSEPTTSLVDPLGRAVPAATARGVASFFGAERAGDLAPAVCRGTACALAGAGEVADRAGARAGTVYCLGYCDRGPAVLRADGEVALPAAGGADPLAAAPARSAPTVRSLAAEPIVTRRLGMDAVSLDSARAAGAYEALERALGAPPDAVLDAVERSGESGRGGAGFPTGTKWRLAAAEPGPRFIVANGDEGDPGAFVDRVLMEDDPHAVLEGMALCAHAIGAEHGVVFVRGEYPRARRTLERAVGEARAAGLLGPSVAGSGVAFDVTIASGRGSYVSGEETAMLNAIEGRRGEPRLRPPYPTTAGLWGRPTVVNNVETLVNVPWIVANGPAAYRARGTADCPGTKAMCLSSGFASPGLVEVEYGTPLRAVIEVGGGAADGTALRAVLLGGPMGSVLVPGEWDVPVCTAAMAERGVTLGHGGIVAVSERADLAALLRHWLEFMAAESCGKCTPCRLGSERALALVREGGLAGAQPELDRLLPVIAQASLCGFGQMIPVTVAALIERFGDEICATGA